MTDNDAVSLKCKLLWRNSILFGLFGFGLVLCLGILKGCAHLALSFETISAIPTNSKTIPEHSELIPNAYLIASHRNALRSRILRAQRLRPEFVLRCCSIITIMLNNVATSSYWSSGAAERSSYQKRPTAATGSTANAAASTIYRPTNSSNSHSKTPKNPQASAFFSTPPIEKMSLSVGGMLRVCYI